MYDIASATAALLALSFAYPIGAVLGRVSEKEIKANKKLFFKLDLTLFSLFTLGSVFFATIYYPLAGILGVLFGLLLVRVAHHINKINVVAVIMGLSYVFGRLGFEIMTLLAMFYLLTRVAITYYKHDDKKVIGKVIIDQLGFIVISFLFAFFVELFAVGGSVMWISLLIALLATSMLIYDAEKFKPGKKPWF